MKKIDFGQNISRNEFIDYVIERLGGSIDTTHARSAISLFIDDLLTFLEEGNVLQVINLGKITLKQFPARKHHDLQTDQFNIAPGNKWIHFKISHALRKVLSNHLDVEKTYGPEFWDRRTASEGTDTHKFWLGSKIHSSS